jgi:DNA invertase Pin-like site-specific DNA recombinase
VVTKLDRMARSVKHLCAITEQLQETGADLKVLDQGIDTTTPGGRLVYHILAAVAEFEHDLIVERTQVGLAAARSRGRKGGRRRRGSGAAVRAGRARLSPSMRIGATLRRSDRKKKKKAPATTTTGQISTRRCRGRLRSHRWGQNASACGTR